MIPDITQIEQLHRRYAVNDKVFKIVYEHCQIIAEIASWCVAKNKLAVNEEILTAGCLLHDIGTYALFNEDAKITNRHNYLQHTILGAALLREEGFDERLSAMVRTHGLMGLSEQEITANGFGMPRTDYLPVTLEARLLCYADRFHSKHPAFNAYDTFVSRLHCNLPAQAQKLRDAAEEFGVPDIESLAKKYQQTII
jgi:uncharacterized protein